MSEVDKNILTGIEKICQISRVLLWDIAKEENLSPIQIQFLDYLERIPQEQRTLTHLTLEFDLNKSTVSDSITNLIKKGFLEKVQDNEDKRVFYLNLTPMAEGKIEKINQWNSIIYEKIKTVSKENKDIIADFFVNLIRSLHEEKVIKSAKMCFYCSNFKNVDYTENSDKRLPYYCSYTDRYFSDSEVNINCVGFICGT